MNIYPKEIVPDWDLDHSKIYYLDPITGERAGAIRHNIINNEYISTQPVTGWAVWDLVIEP